jgi:hypothetical protein
MFEISIIILSRLLLVAIGFLIYRRFFRWEGFEQTVIGRNGIATQTTLRGQQGYISLKFPAAKPAKTVKLNMRKFELRTPWGW